MTKLDFIRVKCWPRSDWPERDQEAWSRGIQPMDPFDDEPVPVTMLSSETLKKVIKGYGRWLSFLAARNWLDPNEPPLARVTEPRKRAYFRALLSSGNSHNTVIGRFDELRYALKVMSPSADLRSVRRIDGLTVYVRLPTEQKVLKVPDLEVLYDWGLRMMDDADLASGGTTGLLAYRDGLLIALLAVRARRRRSMASLTVNKEIFKNGDTYRVELPPLLVKTKKPDRFDLPARLTPHIDRYLSQVRPALLGGQQHMAFWVEQAGGPLTVKGLAQRIHVLSLKRFGYSFGPHRFRHSSSTMDATAAPERPGFAAAVLGISTAVNAAHYDRANQINAVNTLADIIEARRRALARSRAAGEFQLPPQAFRR